jgi:hypothetical protein
MVVACSLIVTRSWRLGTSIQGIEFSCDELSKLVIKKKTLGEYKKIEMEMKYWSNRFRTVQQDEKDLKTGIVGANNHYAGFGAATGNMFRVMSNMSPIEWCMNKDIAIDYKTELGGPHRNTGYPKTKQKTLLDYPSS